MRLSTATRQAQRSERRHRRSPQRRKLKNAAPQVATQAPARQRAETAGNGAFAQAAPPVANRTNVRTQRRTRQRRATHQARPRRRCTTRERQCSRGHARARAMTTGRRRAEKPDRQFARHDERVVEPSATQTRNLRAESADEAARTARLTGANIVVPERSRATSRAVAQKRGLARSVSAGPPTKRRPPAECDAPKSEDRDDAERAASSSQ